MSSQELLDLEEGSEPEPDCVIRFIVAAEEEEEWAEWVGVGGRGTGWRPLGVGPSSGGSSSASSVENVVGSLERCDCVEHCLLRGDSDKDGYGVERRTDRADHPRPCSTATWVKDVIPAGEEFK